MNKNILYLCLFLSYILPPVFNYIDDKLSYFIIALVCGIVATLLYVYMYDKTEKILKSQLDDKLNNKNPIVNGILTAADVIINCSGENINVDAKHPDEIIDDIINDKFNELIQKQNQIIEDIINEKLIKNNSKGYHLLKNKSGRIIKRKH